MPFQITIAIDPSRKIREFFGNSRTKNKKSEKKDEDSIKLNSPDQGLQLESSVKEIVSEPFTVFRSESYDQKDLSGFLVEKREKSYSMFKGAGDSSENQEVSEKLSDNPETCAIKKLIIVSEPRPNLTGCFKRFFFTRKKKETVSQPETEHNTTCDNAIEAFNSLLEEENSLEALVGKAFSLNTMVTIQSIQDDGKPNLILSGSIPFKVTTKDGIINKKVRVKGKLYSPKKEDEYDRSNSSTQSVIRVKVNEQFKLDSSTLEKVSWLTSRIFTQDEYQHIRRIQFGVPETQTVAFEQKKVSNQDGQEHLQHISDIDEKEPSLNIINSGHLKPYTSSVLTNDHKKQLPVTSITIARSKTRLIKFSDGTDFTEKVGRNVITLAAPEGFMYLLQHPGKMEDGYGTIARKRSVLDINSDDNVFTRRCFQMAKEESEYALSRSLNNPNRLEYQRTRRPEREANDFDPQTYYPPGDYSHILGDRYNPLTWIYQNFDKTKRFVQEFNC